MPTKCCWVIHGSLTSERKASTSPSSFINHSTLLLNRALKRQAPCFYMHFEVWALDRLRTRRRVGSTRRRGNHMHDHSRFQRDINDVTGVSLSLSLSLSQKSLTHNIGSASALPIIGSRSHIFRLGGVGKELQSTRKERKDPPQRKTRPCRSTKTPKSEKKKSGTDLNAELRRRPGAQQIQKLPFVDWEEWQEHSNRRKEKGKTSSRASSTGKTKSTRKSELKTMKSTMNGGEH